MKRGMALTPWALAALIGLGGLAWPAAVEAQSAGPELAAPAGDEGDLPDNLPGRNPKDERVKPPEAATTPPPAAAEPETTVRYPMARWVPWTLMGTGAGLTLVVGVALMVVSQGKFKDYDKNLEADPGNAAAYLPLQEEAVRYRNAAFGMYGIGSAIFLAGVIAAIVNRPKVVPARAASRWRLRPSVGPSHASLALYARF